MIDDEFSVGCRRRYRFRFHAASVMVCTYVRLSSRTLHSVCPAGKLDVPSRRTLLDGVSHPDWDQPKNRACGRSTGKSCFDHFSPNTWASLANSISVLSPRFSILPCKPTLTPRLTPFRPPSRSQRPRTRCLWGICFGCWGCWGPTDSILGNHSRVSCGSAREDSFWWDGSWTCF